MFNNYFNDYAGFTIIPKRKLSPKFTIPDIKFHGTAQHHMRSFIIAMTLKGIDKDIFHLIFPSTFDKEAMMWYNTIDP